MKVTIAISPDLSCPEVAYILGTLLEVAGLPFEFTSPATNTHETGAVCLHYGAPTEGDQAGVFIPADAPALWLAAEPEHLDLDGIPALYAGEPPSALFQPYDRGLLFGFDLVRASLWLLSCQEEWTAKQRDRFSRFESALSWLARHDLAEVPVLNLYAGLLARALITVARNRGLPVLRKLRWPEGRAYAVVLSHDVDDAGRFSPRQGLRLLSRAIAQRAPRGIARGIYFAAAGTVRSLTRRPDPYWNFEKVMDLEAQSGFRSTFFFVPEARDVNRDPPYEVDTPRIRDLLSRLRHGGWEIGVHGSFNSYQNAEFLTAEREKLEWLAAAPVVGVRQHYLRLAWPDTFHAQTSAGFTYDSTVGYQNRIGFRAGAAFPFHPYDLATAQPVPLLELPLAIMDGALFWGLKLAPHEATARTLALLKTVRAAGGLAVLLWHQRVWYARRYPGWHQVYGRAVEHVRAEGQAWVATAAQVAGWWLSREGLRLEETCHQGDAWSWCFRSARSVDGLVFSVSGSAGARVHVEGAQARVRATEEGDTHIDLGRLAAGQAFQILLARSETGDSPTQPPARRVRGGEGDSA